MDAGATIYVRNLPHWRQPGATYFVTFRTWDSIPEATWELMNKEAIDWERRLAKRQNDESLLKEYRIFRRRFQTRIEAILGKCHGACLLRDPDYRMEVTKALEFYVTRASRSAQCVGTAARTGRPELPRSKVPQYDLDAFVVMPNHVHLAIRPLPGFELEDILGRIKSYSARQIHEKLGATGRFWMEESFDHIIRDEANYVKTIRYILKNPIKANLKEQEYTLM